MTTANVNNEVLTITPIDKEMDRNEFFSKINASKASDSSNEIKNLSIWEATSQAFDAAVVGYYPFTLMLELGATLGTGTNQLFSTPWSSVGKTMTAKFVRVLSEKVVSGDCSNIESLNYFQQNAFCINEGTYEAVAFRASVAFVAGAASSMAFKGVPLFAVYDGLNAALYDTVSELKKVDDIQKNETLKTIVDFLDQYGAFLFEGLDVFLKIKSEAAKLSADLIKKQVEITNAQSALDAAMQTFKDNGAILDQKTAQSVLDVAKEQVSHLTAKLTETEAAKFHGFIGGYLADHHTGRIKSAFDQVKSGIIQLANTGEATSGLNYNGTLIRPVYTVTKTENLFFAQDPEKHSVLQGEAFVAEIDEL
jgi:hypothetical protein